MSIPTPLTPTQTVCLTLSGPAQNMAAKLREEPKDHLVDFFLPAATRGDNGFAGNDNTGGVENPQTAKIINFGFGPTGMN